MGNNAEADFCGRTLDARTLFCPEPVMLLHNLVREVAPGEKIRILATDPSTKRDIPKFCQFLGHELLHNGEMPDDDGESIFVFIILKVVKPEPY